MAEEQVNVIRALAGVQVKGNVGNVVNSIHRGKTADDIIEDRKGGVLDCYKDGIHWTVPFSVCSSWEWGPKEDMKKLSSAK